MVLKIARIVLDFFAWKKEDGGTEGTEWRQTVWLARKGEFWMSRALRMGKESGHRSEADAKKSDDFYDSPDRNGASGRETGIDTEKYGSFCDSEGHGNH